MQLACGVLAALLSARATGQGQVVAASILEGAAALTAMTHGLRAAGQWRDARRDNILDGGAPFYRTYAAADGGFLAVAAIEAKFFGALLAGLGLQDVVAPASQLDRAGWPGMAQQFAERFATRTRDDWAARFAGTNACVTPVLGWSEAQAHPQMAALGAFSGGLPRTAPRFSATPCAAPSEAVTAGADTRAVLWEIGMEAGQGIQFCRSRLGVSGGGVT